MLYINFVTLPGEELSMQLGLFGYSPHIYVHYTGCTTELKDERMENSKTGRRIEHNLR